MSASPNVASTFNTLTAVAGDSPSDAWAVGYTGNPRVPFPVFQTWIEHWNGSTWNITTAPTIPSSTSSQLLGVAAISSTDAWAVGNYFDASIDTPHACRQGMLRLRMWYPTTLAPAGPARPYGTVERRLEAPLKRPYSYLFSHRGEQTERPCIPRSTDRGLLAAER